MLNQHHDEGIQHKRNIVFYVAVKAACKSCNQNFGSISVMSMPDCVENLQQMGLGADKTAKYRVAYL